MATISLTVNNTTYEYPKNLDDPGWGEEATSWAEAVTTVLSSLLGSGDILETTATIANNQSSAANVVGLAFDTSGVRAANITYSVYRTVTGDSLIESGTIYLNYDATKTSGNRWSLTQTTNNDAGVTFSITDAGQVQYTSTDFSGTSYTGTMKFTAKTLAQ